MTNKCGYISFFSRHTSVTTDRHRVLMPVFVDSLIEKTYIIIMEVIVAIHKKEIIPQGFLLTPVPYSP